MSRLHLPWLFLAALALCSTACSPSGVAVRAATQSPPTMSRLYLPPTSGMQTRTFLIHAHPQDCRAMTSVHRAYATSPCLLSVTAVLKGRGANPIRTGQALLRGSNVQTAYASIAVCLSAPSLAHPASCMQEVQRCPLGTATALPDCYPAWATELAAQFQYNGHQIRRIWLDPCCDVGLGFTLRDSRAFTLPKTNTRGGHLPIGMDLAVTGSIPPTRGVHSRYVLRMTVLPNGGVVFQVR